MLMMSSCGRRHEDSNEHSNTHRNAVAEKIRSVERIASHCINWPNIAAESKYNEGGERERESV